MQNYSVVLSSNSSNSFYCKMAAQSVDLNLDEKLTHQLEITADLETDWNVGLIIGSSGSGKTTLAKEIFGDKFYQKQIIDFDRCVIDQFPEEFEYKKRAEILCGIGLSSVPCWIKPLNCLSNGQQSRAIAALNLSKNNFLVMDEFTSVIDRLAAKTMSHCVQKFARKNNVKFCAISCHYDVIDFLNPCWIIDCNKQEYIDRRGLWQNYKRSEQIKFDVRRVGRETWKNFSKYHYLSKNLPFGIMDFFGLFHNGDQIGFQCFANYTPKVKFKKIKMHFNRTVIHPDYLGFGLGIKMINETSKIMKKEGYEVWGKYSSTAVFNSMIKDKNWRLMAVQRFTAKMSGNATRKTGFRNAVKTYSFKYIGAE